MSKKGRGNKTPKPEREQRVEKEIALVKSGASNTEIQQRLGISRTTLWRDLNDHAVALAEGNKDSFLKLRGMQVGSLLDMAEQIATGQIPPETANAWRSIMADVSRLLGLNSPSKSMHAVLHADLSKVPVQDLSDDELMVIIAREICQDLNDGQINQVREFARSLPREQVDPYARGDELLREWLQPEPEGQGPAEIILDDVIDREKKPQ